ncbi:MAG: TonB-dependent receptor [Bacteroidales bacterium]|nr:TonB-dependent receptor [Bacteroidales bacterium]
MRFRFILFLVLFSHAVMAQQVVTGNVTSAETGEPIAGSTIIIKGTTRGAITDVSGHYSIEVTGPGDVLQFSFIGYETHEEQVGDRTEINVSMEEATTELEDVVVIGYGTVKKDDLTGSVAVVSSEELNRTPTATFTSAIQGKAPGVLVTQNSGQPGSPASIRVRGVGSINRSADPIYVIDGVITSSIQGINPADIESLQVLKDASSAAIYGADGANGVIIITTKRGSIGAPSVTYSAYMSQNKIPRKLDLMNGDQYADFYNTLNERDGINQIAYTDEFRQAYYGEGWESGTDWQDEITTPGYTMNHYLRISGGAEKSNYSISANYYDETGVLVNNNAKRYNLRANSDFAIGKHLKIGETMNISRNYIHRGAADFNLVKTASPLMAVYDEDNKGGFAGAQQGFEFDADSDGVIDPDSETFPSTGNNDKFNPLGVAMLPDNNEYINNFLASIYAEVKLLEGLTFRVLPSVDFTYGKIRNWTPSYDMGVRSEPQAVLLEEYNELLNLSIQNQLNFNRSFGNHTVSATAVHHYRNVTTSVTTPKAVGFPYENLNVFDQASADGQVIEGAIWPYKSIAYLGRIIYDFKGKYLVTASLRTDGNSRFAEGYRWGTFPSFSLGWKLNEDLLPQVDQVNMLKIRAGWGQTGNSNIGRFQYDDFLSAPTQFSPVFGYDQNIAVATYVLSSFANPIVQWESASMLNLGLDANLFNNKIQASVEYYIKSQDNLLVKKPVSHVFGRASEPGFSEDAQPWLNVGELRNSGFELLLSYRETRGELYYGITANLTTIKNEVISIPTEDITTREGYNRTIEGWPIGSLYGYVAERIITPGDFDENGDYQFTEPIEGTPAPGDLKFTDLTNDGKIDADDRTLIGKPIPDMIYGINMEMSYRDFDLLIFLSGMQGFDIFNAERASLSSFNAQDLDHNKLTDYTQNYYREDNPSEEYVRADRNNTNVNDRISTWWIEDGSFLRVKDIQLGYSLPGNIISFANIDNFRIYASFSNLYVFTEYTGRDPEVAVFSDPLNSGTDIGGYPNPRVSTIGIQIDF